jgi:hypothetical protein
MALWEWVLVGLTAALGLSAIAGLMLAAILGGISRDVSRMLETEPWAVTPPLRASRARIRALSG